jgi:hypothetical protein
LGIVDGTDASLQVITIGDSGTALYNVSQSTPYFNLHHLSCYQAGMSS